LLKAQFTSDPLPKEKPMKLLRRLIAISVLLVSMSAVTLAGDIQGPGIAAPAGDSSVEAISELATLMTWLLASIV
jgi:hypothetical protein